MSTPSNDNVVDLAAIQDGLYPSEVQNHYQGLSSIQLDSEASKISLFLANSRSDVVSIDEEVSALDDESEGLKKALVEIDQETKNFLAEKEKETKNFLAEKEKESKSITNQLAIVAVNKSNRLENRTRLVKTIEASMVDEAFVKSLGKHNHSLKLYAVHNLKSVAAHIGALDRMNIKSFTYNGCRSILHQLKNLGLDANKEFRELFKKQDVREKFGDVPFVDTRKEVAGKSISATEMQHRIWVYLGYPLAEFHSAMPCWTFEEEMKRKYGSKSDEPQSPPREDIVAQLELQEALNLAVENAVSAVIGSPNVHSSKDVRDAIAASVTLSLKKRLLPSRDDVDWSADSSPPRKQPGRF